MKRTKVLIPLFLLLFVGGLAYAVPTMAQQAPANHTNWFSNLAQFLSQKLGVDQSKVQSALNDYAAQQKQAMQKNMQNREKSYLDGLVSQGKITSSQEQAILTELSNLHTKYNPANFKNMTPQQVRQQMQQEKTDLTNWAKSNNIDPNLILPPFGRGMGRGMGMHRGWGKPNATPTP